MTKNLTKYLLAAILALASVNSVRAAGDAKVPTLDQATDHLMFTMLENPLLTSFSGFIGTVTGITAGWKAGEIGDQAGKFINDKTGLSKKQSTLKRLAAILVHSSISFGAAYALLTANGAIGNAIVTPQFLLDYPILGFGLSFANLGIGLTLPVSTIIKSARYALTTVTAEAEEDDSNDHAFA